MHRFIVAAFCATIVCIPTSAAAANFAGKWAVSGTLETPDGTMTISPVCTFKQDDAKISGTCKGPSYLGSVEGAVDDATIVWHWYGVATNDDQEPSVTATFKGKLGSDGFIRGTWTDTLVPDGASGTFTAQKVK